MQVAGQVGAGRLCDGRRALPGGAKAATPLASLWPRGGRLSTAGVRALAAYAAAVAAAGTAMAALRGERTAQVVFVFLFFTDLTGSCIQGCCSCCRKQPKWCCAASAPRR